MNLENRHWYAVEEIIDGIKEDQRRLLKSDESPIQIAHNINMFEEAINNLINLLVDWKNFYGYPNISNLKYINKF